MDRTGSAEFWSQIEAHFQTALGLDVHARGAFVEEICEREPELGAELSRLLSAHARGEGEGDDFLLPPTSIGAPAGDQGTAAFLEPGSRIGSCTVRRVIGAGGMAVVYEATQEHPQRTVAVKLIRPGIVTEELLRRFDLEVGILGRLDHRGIATIHEAGMTGTEPGLQPYFVMEHVDGFSLDEYVRANDPTLKSRLELLAEVCDAVNHAHQKGVVHRDLKPANILVTADGQPKILDFGVARVIGDDHGPTAETHVGQIIGTLQYLSPEQAGGDPAELDTRSDVYSLGVIGYELTSGQRPYELRSRLLHEAIRIIREDEPTRLSSLQHALRGDIDTIIATAMAKDPARRYGSASELAADIRRHFRSEPIAARPASLGYHLIKFSRRHRAVVGSAMTVVIALVVAACGFYVAMQRARSAAAMRAETLDFVRSGVFGATGSDVWPSSLQRSERLSSQPDETLSVFRLSSRAAAGVGGWFEGEPEARAELRLLFGDALFSLRDFDGANQQFQPVLDDGGWTSERTRLQVRNRLARVEIAQRRFDEARTELKSVLAEQRRAFGEFDADSLATRLQIVTLGIHESQGAGASAIAEASLSAEPELRELLETVELQLGRSDELTNAIRMALGSVYWELKRFNEAAEHYEAIFGSVDDNDWRRMSANWSLALIAEKQGRPDEAERRLREVVAFGREHLGPLHDRTRSATNGLASFLKKQDRLGEAAELYLDDVASQLCVDTVPIYQLGVAFRLLGDADKALLWSELALRLRERRPSGIAWEGPAAMNSFAQALLMTGDAVRAESWAHRAAEEAEAAPRSFGPEARAVFLRTRGSCLAATGRHAEAFVDFDEAYVFVAERRTDRGRKEARAIVKAAIELCSRAGDPGMTDVWEHRERELSSG